MNYKIIPLISGLLMANAVSAATLIDLNNKPISALQNFISKQQGFAGNPSGLKKVRTDVDFNKASHIRLKQTYSGVPVWKAGAVVHTAAKNVNQSNLLGATTTANGKIYDNLDKDLAGTPKYAFSDEQKNRALSQAKVLYGKQIGSQNFPSQQESSKLIVYIDNDKIAKYGYLVSFYVDDGETGGHRPTMILNASNLSVYKSWDRVLNAKLHADKLTFNTKDFRGSSKMQELLEDKFGKVKIKFEGEDDDTLDLPIEFGFVDVGGIGGNEKTGLKLYDGSDSNYPTMKLLQIKLTTEIMGQPIKLPLCLFLSPDAIVMDSAYRGFDAFLMSTCYKTEGEHNDQIWIPRDNNGTRWKADEVNGGYSPSFDVLYGLTVAKNLYSEWYNTPLYMDDESQEPVGFPVNIHYGRNYDNAFWNGESINFGDGGKKFYPLTSLDVVVHEISHAFTDQRSGLDTSLPQMAALHEAFSDMAAMAAQYFTHGKVTWEIGRDVMRGEGALRYMADPTKDGNSIDNMKDYDEDMNCHHLNGVFNKVFYTIANTPGWDVHKAFDIMVKANMHYWNESMETFEEAACGVVQATKDYKYRISDVRVAFANVGIDTAGCR